MEKIELVERAKMYLKLLSDGVHPVTGDVIPGDSAFVDEKVKRCFSFISQILDEYVELSDKVEKLELLKEQNKSLIFVGDGINDAPVLASVDVGVSMGGVSSDIAVEASDVVLMTEEPTKVVDSILIAKKTKKIVTQNIIFTLMIKVLVLILSAMGISGMWLAIFADVGVCLLAVLNSLRAMILPRKIKQKSKNRR